MNGPTGLTSRSRGVATPAERGRDGRPGSGNGGQGDTAGTGAETGTESGPSRWRGHEAASGEVEVDGASMPVDRCRHCGVVLVDSRRPSGPCPGPNRTLTDFGVTPPAERDRAADPPVGRLARTNRRTRAGRPGVESGDDRDGDASEREIGEEDNGDNGAGENDQDDAEEETPILAP